MALEQLAVAAPLEKLVERIGDDGFFLAEEALPENVIATLLTAFERAKESPHARKQDGEVYALRNILRAVPEVHALSLSAALLESNSLRFMLKRASDASADPTCTCAR